VAPLGAACVQLAECAGLGGLWEEVRHQAMAQEELVVAAREFARAHMQLVWGILTAVLSQREYRGRDGAEEQEKKETEGKQVEEGSGMEKKRKMEMEKERETEKVGQEETETEVEVSKGKGKGRAVEVEEDEVVVVEDGLEVQDGVEDRVGEGTLDAD
jgi:hypothetical protein